MSDELLKELIAEIRALRVELTRARLSVSRPEPWDESERVNGSGAPTDGEAVPAGRLNELRLMAREDIARLRAAKTPRSTRTSAAPRSSRRSSR